MNLKELIKLITQSTNLSAADSKRVTLLVLDNLAQVIEDGGRFRSPRLILSSQKSSQNGSIEAEGSGFVFGRARVRKSQNTQIPESHNELIDRIRAEKITYLSKRKLSSIASSCQQIESLSIPGVFIEAGCALGGSTVLIGSCKSHTRRLLVYDVFSTIPPPSEEDPLEVHQRYSTIIQGKSRGIGGNLYYGYQENLLNVVIGNLKSFNIIPEEINISFVRGLVQDTLIVHDPVAFAHIDVDWYEPVKISLERIYPMLSPGGIIILDDYHNWGGCRKAVDEFLSLHIGTVCADKSHGSMKLTKIPSVAPPSKKAISTFDCNDQDMF